MRPVVLVDSDAITSKFLAEYLQDEGFRVFIAGTAEGGLELLANLNEPSVVLMELVLPDAPGEAFLEALALWGREHRVIVMSSVLSHRLEDARASPLVVAALPEPFGLEELEAKVREAAGDI